MIMMGVATLPDITAELIKHGLPADTPAMTVADAAMPSQQVRTRHRDRHRCTDRTRPTSNRLAITVIGAVAGFGPSATGDENEPRI